MILEACVGMVSHLVCKHMCSSAELQTPPPAPSVSNSLRHIQEIFEYTGCLPLVLGDYLPLCGRGYAYVSYPSVHLCRVAAKSSHPISLQYSQTHPQCFRGFQ